MEELARRLLLVDPDVDVGQVVVFRGQDRANEAHLQIVENLEQVGTVIVTHSKIDHLPFLVQSHQYFIK